ncbi:hypothetical protein [Endozoicomonas sp. ONNA1]|uniref:hypothetical protein n=1 Tax=Endozoicomonas sp. ONNA1 TaxID=2828740 RepID=UPI002148D798|nr:hypothetical protein [Endozoicomonas sp. ONNA1]
MMNTTNNQTIAKLQTNKTTKPIQKGDVFKSNEGVIWKVLEYINAKEVRVLSENGSERSVRAGDLRRGRVKCYMFPSVQGVGFLGCGEVKTGDSVTGKITKAYMAWQNMLERCYSEQFHARNLSYKDCEVAEEWQDFTKFKQWHDNQPYNYLQLDKDLLCYGNKLYSPDTCLFVSQRLNKLLVDSGKGKGISWHKANKKYQAVCSNGNGKSKSLGHFDSPLDALQAYQTFKLKVAVQVIRDELTIGSITPEQANAIFLTTQQHLTDKAQDVLEEHVEELIAA